MCAKGHIRFKGGAMNEDRALGLKEKRIKNLTRAGKGRPKGAKNIVPGDIKAAFLSAFEEMGGLDSLIKWAKRKPDAFYCLLIKLIPAKQLQEEAKQPKVTVTFKNLYLKEPIDITQANKK